MKKYFTFLIIFIFGIAFSQTNRFIYQLQMKLNDQTETMNMVLDIDKDNVKFYDDDFLKNDSISKKTGENWQTNTTSDQLIARKRNTFQNKSFHDNMFDYFVIESEDKINWKIENETKKNGEYTLQKATTNFGGRNWIAWFCPSIPFQEGPYKFRGLPGLIFELNDEKNDFIYSLVKSVNLQKTSETQNFLETHYGNKPVLVSLKQYFKVKLDYYNDPMTEMKKNLKSGGATIMINGEKITSQEQLDQKKKTMQKNIKKYYNPVELDKAIPYPKD
ncbi:GLPGLI family protein [Kaistella sp.]|uniref:GLPGLI family protein n=1 Tax=Kaistella sp. TaxID=2782235 RepID=UPI003C630807